MFHISVKLVPTCIIGKLLNFDPIGYLTSVLNISDQVMQNDAPTLKVMLNPHFQFNCYKNLIKLHNQLCF